MSSNAEIKISGFPEDDGCWFIKWIDEFRLPYLATSSASVKVILQKLSSVDFHNLNNLGSTDIQSILGQRKKDADLIIQIRCPVVMPGTLPLVFIGAIYQRGVYVGRLPTHQRTIELADGGQEGLELSLSQQITPPPGWPSGAPHSLLNRFEYSVVPNIMKSSRCLVINRREYTFIIPRMTIFKAFYAPHTELAKAFCGGPWNDRLDEVICLDDFESGLKTQKITHPEQWNIILQVRVPDVFAPLLALFYFDEFARSCASLIYSQSLQDREGRARNPWYASARIPFKSDKEDLKLTVLGFNLRSSFYHDQGGKKIEKRKFLVTEIIGCSWPSYIPPIGYERANSGNTSPNPIAVDEQAPYVGTPAGEIERSGAELDATHDADVTSPITHLNHTEFHWINKPTLSKLEKLSSKKYSTPPRDDVPVHSERMSTGEDTYQNDAVGKGLAEHRIRTPEKRFKSILEVFSQLKCDGIISSFNVLPCAESQYEIIRDGLACWSFEEKTGVKPKYRPRRGWRLVKFDKNSRQGCIYRCALVVRLIIHQRILFWIEIECRETGEGGFRSPVLADVVPPTAKTISTALEIIAEHKGINMEPPLNNAFAPDGVNVSCYKHIYEKDSNSKFDAGSIRRFLKQI